MLLQCRVTQQLLWAAKLLCQGHLIIKSVDPFVTVPADLDPNVELGFRISTPKMRSPVQLLGDQVMEGELSGLATASAKILGVL